MSLSTAANIAQSSIANVAAETALTSRNIAGANATGIYSRKVADVVATPSGATIISITRLQNQALFGNLLATTASSASQSALSNGLTTLNQTIGNVASTDSTTVAGNSPASLAAAFTNALQSYAAQPNNTSLATSAVSAAQTLATSLNTATKTVQGVRSQADADMAGAVTTINSLLSQFQTLNDKVVSGSAVGADVTDLQDSRDEVLKQLSQQIGISTTSGQNNDISIYTDSGVTLFQRIARTVSMQPTSTYAAGTTGNAVYVDGIPVTGSGATMPISSGKLAGLATLRDSATVTYQAQLDAMANGLISATRETNQVDPTQPDQPGLFTTPTLAGMPTTDTGLAGTIKVNANVDPTQGGSVLRLRDGGISDTADAQYTYNTTGQAGYSDRVTQLIKNLQGSQSFSSDGQITTTASLSDYAAASASWLESQRSTASAASDYSSTLLSTATTALSNATGVNIDDEMSKMLDLENSYSSSAKLLSAINSMFNSLISVIGN